MFSNMDGEYFKLHFHSTFTRSFMMLFFIEFLQEVSALANANAEKLQNLTP